MTARRVIPLPHMPEARAGAVKRALEQRERADRAVHDNEREIARAASGAMDIKIPPQSKSRALHKLDRPPIGWRLIDITAAGTIAGPIYRVGWDKSSITLQNDNAIAVTVRVEVF